MPLWVIVELMSFSNLSQLYSSMYFSVKDTIASAVGVGRDTLENHLHCLSVGWNKITEVATQPWGGKACDLTTIDGLYFRSLE